jgi:DNA-binding response OmpR family regulator
VNGLEAAREPGVDAVVLDLLLPRMNGLAVCRALRGAGSDVYVLMLTARGTVRERVAGLDAGADDYLVKPFALEELSARLRAVHRRRQDDDERRLTVGDLVLDPLAQRVWRGETEVDLSRREFAVLRALMENAGRVVSRSFIFDQVWDGEADLSSNAIDVHVSKLRARIDKPFGTDTITTLRGVGYRLETRA